MGKEPDETNLELWQESESPEIVAAFLDVAKTFPTGPTESIYTEEELEGL